VPPVRDDNPPTGKIPVVRDDNPPTSKIPVIKDDDQPTTILAAVTETEPASIKNSASAKAKGAGAGKVTPDEKAAAPMAPVAVTNPAFVKVATLPPPRPVPAVAPAVAQVTAPSVADAKVVPAVQPVFVAPNAQPSVAAPVAAPAVASGKPPKGKRRNPLLVALIVVLALVLVAGGILAALTKIYEGKAKIGTQVAGVNVAGQTADDLAATAQNVGGSFTITADFQGKDQTFSMTDLGVTLDAQKTAQQALAADSGRFGWLPFHSADVPLAYTYSDDQIQQVLTKAFLANEQLPQAASVTFDDSTGKYTATPDTDGLNIDPSPVTAAIDKLALGDAAPTVTLTTVNATASVKMAAATQAATAANALVAQPYTFTAGAKSVTLTPSQLSQFVTLTPNETTGAIDVGVDQAGLASGLPGILSSALAQPPVNERDLYTPDGSKLIAVDIPGQNGTVVADADAAAAAKALAAAMTAGQPLTMAVTTTTQKYGIDKVPVGGSYDVPNGSKWIDVNQTTFKVTLYEGTTQVFQTTAVTGAPATPTQNGTYYIYLRYTLQTMRGHNADGTPYTTPDVPWVSYFNGSQALHGAYWRSTFGYQASHGCVNLPVPDAKFIFDWAPLGTKVVVHN